MLISSRQVITEELPLLIRRDELSLNYYDKMNSLLQYPAFKFIAPEQETLYSNKIFPILFAIRIQKNKHTKI